MNFFKNITPSHFFTFLFQMSRVLNILIMLFGVPIFLDKIEQGYWFSFISLAALILIADSGFSNIILQFAAHEFAFLKIFDNKYIVGDEKRIIKLSSFFIFSIKLIIKILIFSTPVIFFIGFYVLSKKNYNISWLLPWIIYVISSGINLINNLLLYFWEGCNFIKESQKIRFLGVFINTFLMIIFLFLGFKLYALSYSLFISSTFTLILIWFKYKLIIFEFLKYYNKLIYNWKNDFFPLFLKYSISWISGYFLFQMYSPIVFHFYGPELSGKVGISITLFSGVLAFSNIWLYVITPKINMLISKKQWKKLDFIFFKNFLFSVLTFLFILIFILFLFYFYYNKIYILNRFMSFKGILILGIGWFFQLIVNSFAIYLRAHKEEPLFIPSIVSAVYVVITTYLFSKFLSFDYLFLGFLTSYIWGLPLIIKIFNDKRKKHHENINNSNTNI